MLDYVSLPQESPGYYRFLHIFYIFSYMFPCFFQEGPIFEAPHLQCLSRVDDHLRRARAAKEAGAVGSMGIGKPIIVYI